ncbi:restriction endonuclease subunit S [Elizabethkingia anophelis]|nr:restriction endonuclease subunit S [Elizabethkingia anophelis]
MTEENKNVKKFPNLRFTGFENEWEVKKLGEIANKIGDGLHGTPDYTDNSEYYFINGNNLVNGRIEIFDNTKKVSNHIFAKNNKDLKENTLLISINGTIGSIAKYNGEKVMLGKSVGYFNFKNNSDFIYFTLHTRLIQDYFFSELTGSTIKNLSLKTLRETSIYLPSSEEQYKISCFLSLVEDRIQTQRKIIEQLETLMKGNLEKIFRQKLRFKNKQGNYFSIWKTMKLDEICDIKKGEQLNKEDLTESGNYPCLNGGMSFSGYTDKFNSDENTITISEGGNSCGFINFMKSKFWLGGHCYKVILKKDISKDFLFHLLKFYEREIMNLRVGSGLPNIQQKDLKNLQLLISEDIEEQNKIANFLSSIQDKVETEKQILEKLELQKKFLLGNLFV